MPAITKAHGNYTVTEDDTHLFVTKTGSCVASEPGVNGVDIIDARDSRLVNYGRISGEVGVYVDDSNVHITNAASGVIDGGLYAESIGYSTIKNLGDILGGVSFSGWKSTLINAGTITGGVQSTESNGSGGTLVNTGIIIGGVSGAFLAQDFTLVNSGVIVGDVHADARLTTIHNSGTIVGNVYLADDFADGPIVFNGRGGTVSGHISTGYSSDTIIAGDDGEWMDGSYNDDLLVGGAGNDTFYFRYNTGHDTVKHFTVGNDLLQIDRYGPQSFAELTLTDDGHGGTNVSWNEGSFDLLHVRPSSLSAADFRFGALSATAFGAAHADVALAFHEVRHEPLMAADCAIA